MAAKKGAGRLDASALEAALEDAFRDQDVEDVQIAADGKPMMISGKETVGHIDANFAGKLHDKLAQQADDGNPIDEPSGLRAPATTRMLTAKELAELDEDDDGDEKVVLDTRSHGIIDQVDSKLVTELNKKLNDEITHHHHGEVVGPESNVDNLHLQFELAKLEASKNDVSKDLSAALESKLGEQAPEEIEASVERRFSQSGIFSDEDDEVAREVQSSGLRAPQSTVKLSAEALAALEDDDEDDPALFVAQTHGAISSSDVNGSLVQELKQKLGGQPDKSINESGFRAPANTVKLDRAMIAALDDDEEEKPDCRSHGNVDTIDGNFVSALQKKLEASNEEENISPPVNDNEEEKVERGCRAPKPTQKLPQDLLESLEAEGAYLDDADDPLNVPHAAACKLNKLADTGISSPPHAFDRSRTMDGEDATPSGGLRAPQPTKLITADMLAGLDDEDDIDVAQGPDPIAASAVQSVPKANAGKDNAQFNLGPDLPQVDPAKPKKGVGFFSSGGVDASFADSLQKKFQDEFGVAMNGASTEGQAPEECEDFADGDDDDGTKSYMSGLKAPATTQMLTASQLELLDEDEDTPAVDTSRGLNMPVGSTSGNKESTTKSGTRAPNMPPSVMDELGADPTVASFLAQQLASAPSAVGGPSAAQLATLTAAAAALQDVMPADTVLPQQQAQRQQQQQQPQRDPLPSQASLLTMDTTSATKVVQTARGLPESQDMWGQPRPQTTSCQLRLAWLSKDEVRKENDHLRKEILSLRAEIDMHRKGANLARKV